jgi:hypothetical protein
MLGCLEGRIHLQRRHHIPEEQFPTSAVRASSFPSCIPLPSTPILYCILLVHLTVIIIASRFRVVVTNSFSNPNPRQSASSLLLNKLKFSRAFLCRRYLVPESCGICLSACCRSPRMAVVSDFWRREAAGGPALRLPLNKMNAGDLLLPTPVSRYVCFGTARPPFMTLRAFGDYVTAPGPGCSGWVAMRGMLTVPALIYILVVLGSKLRIVRAMQPSPGLAAVSKIYIQACRHRGRAWISSQDVLGVRSWSKGGSNSRQRPRLMSLMPLLSA